jgi:predicted nucleic acid-binding protein|tara:strand:+ start:788 stop:1006 length:219 start_codon:yes stop_codon:yes gene_type:complete
MEASQKYFWIFLKGKNMAGFFEWLFGPSKPKKELEDMTKRELEALGRKHKIELDRRYKQKTLVRQLRKKMGE